MSQKLEGRQTPRSARWVGKLGTEESQWLDSQQAQDPRRANVSIWVRRQKKSQYPSSKAVRQAKITFSHSGEGPLFGSIQTFNWMDEAHAKSGRAICSTQSLPIQKLILSQNTPIETFRKMSDEISGHPVNQSSWNRKLTIHRGWGAVRPQGNCSVSRLPEIPWEQNQWQDELGRLLSI